MSKIFEALHRVQGNIPEMALSALADAPTAGTSAREAKPAAASNGESRPVPSAIAVATPEESFISTVRTVPLRIPASVPALPFDGDHWQANEQYRIVRTRLLHHSKRPRMIVV